MNHGLLSELISINPSNGLKITYIKRENETTQEMIG